MSVEFSPSPLSANQNWPAFDRRPWGVLGETDRLTDVMLCRPSHLAAVPCCSVTRESLRDGFVISTTAALAQHRALERALQAHGVRCHLAPPQTGMPDLCFTRDSSVMTPWGLLGLRPATDHRAGETAQVLSTARDWGVDIIGQVEAGTVEGGDICIVRPGMVIIGCSGERTDEAGADWVASLFRDYGWDALIHRYDPHFLHLDTQFCMLSPNLALACVDVLDDGFLARVRAAGIELVPVTYKEARRLGCNILALGEGRILASDEAPRVNAALRARGFEVETVAISQFTRCGGGVHCLTAPLRRTPG